MDTLVRSSLWYTASQSATPPPMSRRTFSTVVLPAPVGPVMPMTTMAYARSSHARADASSGWKQI